MSFYQRLLLVLVFWLFLGLIFALSVYAAGTSHTPATAKFSYIWLLTTAFTAVGLVITKRSERLGRGFMVAVGLANIYACIFYLLS